MPLGHGDPPLLTRRTLVSTVAVLGAAGLVACRRDEEEGLHASAARGSGRIAFPDTLAWVDDGTLATTVAFVPWSLNDDQRRAVLEARSVYPTLAHDPMLEMRLELRPASEREDRKITARNLRAIVMTFWHFDDPPAVIRLSTDDGWQANPEVEVLGLDGEARRAGWVSGTVRGRKIFNTYRGSDEAYAYNLRFALSL